MGKRIAVCIALLLLLLSLPAGAAEVQAPSVKLDPVTARLSAGGKTPYAGGQVTILVKNDAGIYYMRGMAAGEDGSFTFQIQLDAEADPSGTYTVLLGGAGLTAVEDSFLFISATDDAAIIAATKNIKTASAMEAVVAEWGPKCGLDTTGDFALLSGDGQEAVYDSLCRRTYAGGLDFAAAFAYSAAVVRLNEASETDVALLEEKAEILEIDLGEDSRFAALADKSAVYAAMLGADLPANDKAAVQKLFEAALNVSEVNELTTENRDEIPEYVEKLGGDLEDFNRLSKTKQATAIKAVMKELEKKPFADAEAFLEAFDDAVKEAGKKTSSPGSSSSSSSSSGGGGGMQFAADDKTVENAKNENTAVSTPAAGTETTPAPPVQTGVSFFDVPAEHWAAESIAYLSAQGILAGYEDGTFRPDSPVKREEFVKIIVAALPIPAEETAKTFSDVAESDWFYAPVMQAYAVNLVKGVDFGVFGAGQHITREQLCTMVWRGMKLCDLYLTDGKPVSFTDADAVSDYAAEAVEALSRGGVIGGMGDGSFAPQGTATRAQVAKIMYGLLKGGIAA